jgi:hypothetical protein
VARVWRREEVFKGRFAEDAPDLLLEPSPMYSLTHARSAVEAADWLSGDHRMDGVLAAAGPNVSRERFPQSARLVDLAPTILATVGAAASVRHSGSALAELVGDEAAASAAARASEHSGAVTAAAGLSETEAEELEGHLRGLGYLE